MSSGKKQNLVPLRKKDLNSLISFNIWLKNNISIYKNKKPLEKEMLVIIKHIEKVIHRSSLEEKKEYKKLVKKLINDIERKIKRR